MELQQRLLQRCKWSETGERVLVACSGGADSLALAALAVAGGRDVVLGHVDHGLRSDSCDDLAIVEAAGRRLGVDVVGQRLGLTHGPNLEAVAREARYVALQAMAAENGCAWILTAHTRDDQAETMLLALLRGSATDGMAGIPAMRGNIARPLLDITAAETRELCFALGWTPTVDPMNSDAAFRRVWLRREVIPFLEVGAERDLSAVLSRQAELFAADAAALNAMADEFLCDGDPTVSALIGAPRAIARRALRRWLPTRITSEMLEAVLCLRAGGAIDIGSGHRVRRSGDVLKLEASEANGVPKPVVLGVPGSARFGDIFVTARIEAAPPAGWPDGRSSCVLDADYVGDEVVLRRADSGERFTPQGMSGRKTVSAALAETRLSLAERRQLPVASRADGEILWVLGYRGARPAGVTTATRRYCWMTIEAATK